MTENPFTAVARKHKLTPFGGVKPAKNGSSGEKKVNPFAVVAGKIDLDEIELDKIEKDLVHAMDVYLATFDEEQKLFKTVDKLSLRNQTHTEKYQAAHGAWNIAWRKVDRAYDACQTLTARRNKIRQRRNSARNGRKRRP
jgi:hypothetical protein